MLFADLYLSLCVLIDTSCDSLEPLRNSNFSTLHVVTASAV